MVTRAYTLLAILLLAPLLLAFGCAPGATSDEAASSRKPLPLWVRVAVPSRDGRSIFVGGISFASDVEEAESAAFADAESRLAHEAQERFVNVFNRYSADYGTETTAMERMGLRTSVARSYQDRMVASARRDSVYLTPCVPEGSEGKQEGSSAVCQAFAMISVDDAAWDPTLADVLLAEKEKLREQGEPSMAGLAEWIARQLLEPRPVEGTEKDR